MKPSTLRPLSQRELDRAERARRAAPTYRRLPKYRGGLGLATLTRKADGTYTVRDRRGREVPGVAVTAAGELVADAPTGTCTCGCDRSRHLGDAFDGPCRKCKSCVKYADARDDIDASAALALARSILNLVRR